MTNTTLMQVPVAILADDLSGACDCGVEFLSRSARVTVHVAADSFASDEATIADAGVHVVNTESRDMDPRAAAASVHSASRRLLDYGAQVILKKGDSAFRGNFVEELDSVIDTIRPAVTVVCPAIPDFGRTTIDGVQRIDGVPVDEGFYARDPKHSVPSARVVGLLEGLTRGTVSHLPLERLRQPESGFSLPDAGGWPVVVVDGQINADLDLAAGLFWPGGAAGLVEKGAKVLFVGGQGIAAAIAKRLPVTDASRSGENERGVGSVLVIAGSLHPATRAQVSLLAKTRSLPSILLPEVSSKSALEGVVTSLVGQADSDGLAILDTGQETESEPEVIESAVADVSEAFMKQRPVRALLVTGGSMAFAVSRRLGIERLVLSERLATGAVLAKSQPGVLPDICVKGGSLGEPDTMVRFVDAV